MWINKISKSDWLVIGFLIALLILAWSSVIDKSAYLLNLNTLKETTSSFISLKLIDSRINMVANIPIIGDSLNSIKDFLDRASMVMLVSTMSIGLQKIFIVAFQSVVVNILLSVPIAIVIFNKFITFMPSNLSEKILKISILFLVIRFVIPLMTFTLVSIESATYKMKTEVSKDRIDKMEKRITELNTLINDDKKVKLENKQKELLFTKKITELENTKKTIEEEIEVLKKGDKSFIENPLVLFKDLEPSVKKKIAEKEKQIDLIVVEIEKNESAIDELDTSFNFNVIGEKVKIAISNLKMIMNEMFDTIITTITLFLFRTVIFPILFIWGLFKFVNSLFEKNFAETTEERIINKLLKKEEFLK